MADLRKAKMQMGQAERKLLVIAVLYDASVAYFNWKNFEEFQMYTQYNTNAETLKAIQSLINKDDKRAIVWNGISLKVVN
jgi:hypothetical protein